jgi:hypothetical protein
MAIGQEAISEGGKYVSETNSLGHAQVKEVLKIIPDHQDSARDLIEYQAKVMGSSAPWVRHKCSRKTFAGSIISSAAKMAS